MLVHHSLVLLHLSNQRILDGLQDLNNTPFAPGPILVASLMPTKLASIAMKHRD